MTESTLESLLRSSPFEFVRDYVEKYAVIGCLIYCHPNGHPMTRNEWYRAIKRERELWDRITLEMVEYEHALGHRLPGWMLAAQIDAWKRSAWRKHAKDKNS